MRTKVPLRELSELEVNWVSLVDRGANRIPFRIIKSDTTKEPQMGINLSKLGLKKTAVAQAAVSITGVVIAKGDQATIDLVRKTMLEQGVTLTKDKKFPDGTVAIFEEDKFDEQSTVIRLSEDAALVVKGFEPYCLELDKLTFGEAADARGYYDNVRGAMSVLSDMVMTSLYKAEDPVVAATEIQKVMGDFSSYVMTLTKALPKSVFKVEQGVAAAMAAVEKTETSTTTPVVATEPVVEPAKTEPVVADPVVKAEFKNCEGCKTAEACAKAGKCAVEKTEATKVEDNGLKEVLAAMSGLSTAMQAVGTQVSTLAQKVEGIENLQKATEQKLAEVQKKADDTTQVLKNTVVGSDPGGDAVVVVEPVRKNDGDLRTGIFDTAFISKSARR